MTTDTEGVEECPQFGLGVLPGREGAEGGGVVGHCEVHHLHTTQHNTTLHERTEQAGEVKRLKT